MFVLGESLFTIRDKILQKKKKAKSDKNLLKGNKYLNK